MEKVAPEGPVYQAGTLSGNPLAVSAGLATLKVLKRPGTYEELERKSALLYQGMAEAAREAGLTLSFNRVGSMLCIFFTETPVVDYTTACTADTRRFAAFFQSMLEQGIYLAPSQFEAVFVSLAHTDEQIQKTVEAARKAFAAIKNT